MIILICGLIGAGKSEFASKRYEHVTECEEQSKSEQITETFMLSQEFDVAHITTYPTDDEIIRLSSVGQTVRYIWVNTPPYICMQNVINRGRQRDLIDIAEIEAKNEELYRKFAESEIKFEQISLFDTNERW